MTERYRLTEDGFGMQVSYTIEDPVYLAEPATQEGSYRKVSDHEFSNVPCDPETARRHLTFEWNSIRREAIRLMFSRKI